MQINAVFDSSTSAAPAGFKTAVAAAIAFVEAAFSSAGDANVTDTITFSWGNAAGGVASTESSAVSADYTEVTRAMSLAGVSLGMYYFDDPFSTSSLEMTTADARQLGFYVPAQNDATITLSSSQSWSFDPSVVAGAGQYDAVGALIHEITEALGRTMGSDGNLIPSPLALSRFSVPGQVDTSNAADGYFSVDNGATNLGDLGEPGGDLGDFTFTGGDPFGYAAAGKPDPLSLVDFQEVEAVGYQTNPNIHSGGGSNLTVSGAPNAAVLMNSNGAWDTVTFKSTGGSLSILSDQASVVGSGVSIDFYAGAATSTNSVSLYGAGSQADTVMGSDGVVTLNSASATVSGASDTVWLYGAGDNLTLVGSGSSWDTVWGSNGVLQINGSQVSVVGGDDRITLQASAIATAVSLYNTGGQWDTVKVGGLTSLAPDNIVLNSAKVSVLGDDDVVYFDGASSDAVSFYNTGAATMQVYGSNGSVVLNGTRASIHGGGEYVYFGGTTSSDIVSLSAGKGAWDAVYGSGGTVNVYGSQVSIVGGGDAVTLDGSSNDVVSLYATAGSADVVTGSGGAVVFNGAQATLEGGSLTLDFGAALGLDTVTGYAASDILNFSHTDWASYAALTAAGAITQVGANTVIKLDAGDAVTLTDVAAASLTSAHFSFY